MTPRLAGRFALGACSPDGRRRRRDRHGRIVDRRGVRPAVVMGSARGAVGLFLPADRLTDLSLSHRAFLIARVLPAGEPT